MKTKRKWLNIGLSENDGWSPRLESNQYPTLRRHVHYPLCYGEDAGQYDLTGGIIADPPDNLGVAAGE